GPLFEQASHQCAADVAGRAGDEEGGRVHAGLRGKGCGGPDSVEPTRDAVAVQAESRFQPLVSNRRWRWTRWAR
ncbi:MAG: hypothetical protein ACK56I_31105, partial [bacterium]